MDYPSEIISLNTSKEADEGFTQFYFQYDIRTYVKMDDCNKDGTLGHFKQCMIEELLKMSNNYWTPYLKDESYPPLLDPEQVLDDYGKIIWTVWDVKYSKTACTCVMPCNKTFYSYPLLKNHRNTLPQFYPEKAGPSNDSELTFGHSGNTEVVTEYLYMDFNALLSAIGGNLGMFLGWSAYSTYQKISEKIRTLLM